MNKVIQELLTKQQRDDLDNIIDLDMSWCCLTLTQLGFVQGYVQAGLLANERKEMSDHA